LVPTTTVCDVLIPNDGKHQKSIHQTPFFVIQGLMQQEQWPEYLKSVLALFRQFSPPHSISVMISDLAGAIDSLLYSLDSLQ
ncbi:MAG TPA: hypothetical protein PLA70_11360, partial [Tenuifilaceae bacterium]|nr:hypothetical protein [Tenuifilaceae bacterium]HQK66333.1 hypothetical protein [Tenuifilaceae bacterium]